MAKRRSKWRRTWQTLKKMMQEARKTRAYQSLRQCPACGNPYSLSISINIDKESDRKSADVICSICGFRYKFDEIPAIADEFWVYSRILDIVQKGEVIVKEDVTTDMTNEARSSIEEMQSNNETEFIEIEEENPS